MSKAPKLRFKEFSGDWKEKKFNTIFLDIKNKTSDTVKYPLYSLTIENGVVPKSERYEREFLVTKDEDNFKVVNKNEFVYNPMNLRFGALARYKGDTSVSVSGYYNVFKVIDNSPESFWDNYLKTNRMMYIYNTIATGSLIEKRRVHFTQFIELKLPVPSQKEQEKIASFFSLIDDKISLQGEKLRMLKDYKKGIMQKIFSRELRFKDDEGRDYPEWEVTTIENVADLEKGFTPDTKNEKNWRGDTPWLSIADMKQGKYVSDVSKHISYEALGNKKLVPKGTLIMSFKLTLGRLGIINREMMTNEAICHFYWKNKNINTEYMYYYLSTVNIESFGCRAAKGITLNNDSLNSIVVKLPVIEEQNKIADILMKIDRKVEKEQEKLDSGL